MALSIKTWKFFALFFWVFPPIIGFIIFYLSIPIGCLKCKFVWSRLLDAQSFILIVIAVLWIFAIFATLNVIHITEPRRISKSKLIQIFGFIGIILGTLVIGYSGYESIVLGLQRNEKMELISNNNVTTIYESDDYNAFPKLLQLQNGSLWTVWYQADWHIDSNNDGKILQAFSNDNGTTWTSATVIADDLEWDTRNPAIGQLNDGSLVLMYMLYDGETRSGKGSAWIYSSDGIIWSNPRIINITQFNPVDRTRFDWISPFGNLIQMGSHFIGIFYGGLSGSENIDDNRVIMLELDFNAKNWSYYCSPLEKNNIGFNEADITEIGTGWLILSRSSEKEMYYAYSPDGLNWTHPKATPYRLGHSPDVVTLNSSNEIYALFAVYRGENGILRGGAATFMLSTNEFTCEHEILYTSFADGNIDSGYASVVRLSNTEVGFVNYDVVECGKSGSTGTTGSIIWQKWAKK